MANLANITLENFDPPWLWVLIIVASLAVLAMGYRSVYQRSGRKVTWALALLRVAAVGLIFIALVKPAWQRVETRTDKPVVAVIVDDSQSMSLPHAGTARFASPEDNSQAGGRNGGQATRYAAARRWLDSTAAGALLRERFDVALFDLAGRPLAGDLPPQPTAERSDITASLTRVAGRLRGRQAAGVVMISDGRDTTGRRDAMALSEYPLPVNTIGFRSLPATTASQVDIAIDSVQAPSRVLVDNRVPVEVLVRKDGGPATDVPLTIERAGRQLATQSVSLGAGATERRVTIDFTPAEPGQFVLAAAATPMGNERTTANNRRLFQLRVDADPVRVLYVEGTLRPEFKFLRSRLAEDPDIDLITFVRSASPDEAATSGAMVGNELTAAERLEQIDVVLLGDFQASMLDEAAYERLRDWVDAGGGMMILGGYQNLTSTGLYATPLSELIPVEPARGMQQINEPFTFSPTEAGLAHPALTLTGDRIRDARMWERLPAMLGITATGPARPAATVLARHPRTNPDVADETGAGDRGYAVLATQPFGRGFVTVLTADTTWRWSRLTRLRGESDALYARFWSQWVRHLAQRQVQAERSAVTLATDRASYERGEPVAIEVERNPAVALPGEGDTTQTLRLMLRTPDGRSTSIPAERDAIDSNRWRARVFPDRGGRFEISAELMQGEADTEEAEPAAERVVANQRTEFVVQGSQRELEDPQTDEALMRRIARLTGGGYAEVSDDAAATQWIENLRDQPITTRRVQTSRMWNSPWVLVAFIALVTLEWILRRKHRLV